VYAVIPVSCALMLLYVIKDTMRIIKGSYTPPQEATGTFTED